MFGISVLGSGASDCRVPLCRSSLPSEECLLFLSPLVLGGVEAGEVVITSKRFSPSGKKGSLTWQLCYRTKLLLSCLSCQVPSLGPGPYSGLWRHSGYRPSLHKGVAQTRPWETEVAIFVVLAIHGAKEQRGWGGPARYHSALLLP